MITHFKVKNFKTFEDMVDVSFTANGQIKRFLCNTFEVNNKRVLKTLGIYGPNNTGKTCLILAIANLRNVMLNYPHDELCNVFINDNVTVFEVEYVIKKRMYRYEVSYDCKKRTYLKEKLSMVSVAASNPSVVSESIILERKGNAICIPELNISSKDNSTTFNNIFGSSYPIFIALHISKDSAPTLHQAQIDYKTFADSLVLIRSDLNDINIKYTLDLIKTDSKARKFISEFIKNCDLHISDFGFSDDVTTDVDISSYISTTGNNESLKFYSVHNNQRVPTFIFDSIGTRKIIALSGYIYYALTKGAVLLIDEIDSSLHHILTRAIIQLFNNDLNKKAQLVFSTHDLLLLDVEKLFRKDQIYLTSVDDSGKTQVMSLDISSKDENGIRGNENIVDYYLHGRFGKIPTPELFDVLEDALDD